MSVRLWSAGCSASRMGLRANGRSASKRAQISSRLRAKSGKASYHCRATALQRAPWPGNMKAVPPSSVATPRTTSAVSAPSANESRAPISSSRVWPRTTARCSNNDRVDNNECATSATSTPGAPTTKSRNRTACARNADSERPDTTHGTTPPTTGTPPPATDSSSAGASSTITCAFVPLAPKADTPARRTRPAPPTHGRACVNNSTAPADQSTCDDGRSTCNVRGNTPHRNAITILITPATPAAACV